MVQRDEDEYRTYRQAVARVGLKSYPRPVADFQGAVTPLYLFWPV
jgi:hypothetical protein